MSDERTLGEILGEALAQANAEPRPQIIAAGSGDTDALRALATASYEAGCGTEGLFRLGNLVEALTFMRLAAANGTTVDLRSIVFLYGEIAATCRMLGDEDAAVKYEAQGLCLAETMAVSGDEEVAAMVVQASSAMGPATHREALRLRSLVVASCTAH